MRANLDYDPNVAELVDGVPTAKNQDGQTLEELEKEFENTPIQTTVFDGRPLC